MFARARRLSPDKLAAAKEAFKKLLEIDVIQPSNSPWSSPLHMVEKPSGGWRACGDYRALNAASEDDRYPMPHVQDFTIQMEGKSIFSKVDLVRAYNQVPMNASDIAKTAIVTPFGLFEFKCMPFGLRGFAKLKKSKNNLEEGGLILIIKKNWKIVQKVKFCVCTIPPAWGWTWRHVMCMHAAFIPYSVIVLRFG